MAYKNTRRGFTQKVVNKNCHPEFISGSTPLVTTQYKEEMLKQVQHDKGMGFTLIELLVVVLIIGILAAVAVPQYQKAVEKSRATQAISMLRSVYTAATVYQLREGVWPSSFAELDIAIPWSGHETWDNSSFSTDTLSNDDWSIQLYTENSGGDLLRGVFVGRLSGKYAGAGFIIWRNWRGLPQERALLCAERTERGKIFTGLESGDYCQKIFGGTILTPVTGILRYYLMP